MTTPEIELLVTCPICLDTLRSPKVLHCLHSLCCDCLKRYVISNGYDQYVPCPSCRLPTALPDPGGTAGVDGLQTNFVLNSLIDAVASKYADEASNAVGQQTYDDSIVCDGCKYEKNYVQATMRCTDCEEFLCDCCVKMHRRNKKSQLDQLITVDEYLSSSSAQRDAHRRPARCSTHAASAVSLFCSTCDRLVCTLCSSGGCLAHQYTPISSAAERARHQLLGHRARLNSRAAVQRTYAEEVGGALEVLLDQERCTLAELERQHEYLRSAVQEAFEKATARVRASAEENKKSLAIVLEEIQTRQASLESCAQHIDASLGDAVDAELLLAKRKIEELVAALAAAACGPPRFDLLQLSVLPVRSENVELMLSCVFNVELASSRSEIACAPSPGLRAHSPFFPAARASGAESALFDPTQAVESLAGDDAAAPPQAETAALSLAETDEPRVPPEPPEFRTVASVSPDEVSPWSLPSNDATLWTKICDIDTGRSCVRSIAFNTNGKLLAACDDGLKVAVREGISDTLLGCDSTLVAVSEGGLIVVVLKGKRELRCYYQNRESGLKLLWRKSLQQLKFFGALSLATQGDRVALLVDGSVSIYRLADGSLQKVLKKDVDGAQLFTNPSAVTLDHGGRVLLAELHGSRLRAVDDQGTTVWQHDSGAAERTEYCALCVDLHGDVYAADSRNHRVVLFSPQGRLVRLVSASRSEIHCPTHLAIYKRTVAVCHSSVHRISIFRLSDLSSECTV